MAQQAKDGSVRVNLEVLSHSEAARLRVADELRALGVGEVRFDRHDRMLYATDASIYQVEPIGVVVPWSTAASSQKARTS